QEATQPEQAAPPAGEENLWQDLLVQIHAKRPLISPWVAAGILLKVENGVCIIGFPKDQGIAMDTIQRPSNRTFIENLLSSIAGKPLTFKCELREGLVVAPPVLPEVKQEKPADPKAKTEEDFKNDPKIKKAMEIFQAEILTQ
ncbi:MAG TPA: hypothetical protein VG733_12045, partial [Chthoniobacteraceae bacterium]|nr:hypothetical protein [Chthoniobacteraceae bacterium]